MQRFAMLVAPPRFLRPATHETLRPRCLFSGLGWRSRTSLPLEHFGVAAGGTRRGLMVTQSARCADCTAVLGQASRRCLSVANAVSEVSSAAGCKTEQRRVVGAQRRPRRRSAVDCPGTPLPRKPSHIRPAGLRSSKLSCAPATPRVCRVKRARDSASGRTFAVEVGRFTSVSLQWRPAARSH